MSEQNSNEFTIVRVFDLDRLITEIAELRERLEMQVTADDALTPQQVAEFLQMSEHTILDLAAEGRIPAKKVGRQWRFSRARLIVWLSEGDSHVRSVVPLARKTGDRTARRK